MTGAGTASPDEAIATAIYPASAIMVDEDWEMGLSIFSPRRSYSAGASQANGNFGAFNIEPSDVNCGSEYLPIPYFGSAWRINDTAAVAVNFYDHGDMNSDYNGGTAILDLDGRDLLRCGSYQQPLVVERPGLI
ncbi:MAG: hypothetical protein OSB45_13100 [Pseudomonadales bacterium]|jgi:long-chain fatty acid transport protein|nr:hypothetical protein [Pseudomonadales bacterium]|tara:strand:- start:62 stop:463 length:402 start_codon:yes stop_codon:yes gene_type:complete